MENKLAIEFKHVDYQKLSFNMLNDYALLSFPSFTITKGQKTKINDAFLIFGVDDQILHNRGFVVAEMDSCNLDPDNARAYLKALYYYKQKGKVKLLQAVNTFRSFIELEYQLIFEVNDVTADTADYLKKHCSQFVIIEPNWLVERDFQYAPKTKLDLKQYPL